MSPQLLCLITDQPVYSSRMQTTSDGNIRSRRMPRRITQQINHGAREVVLGAQALVGWREPHLLALALALELPDAPRHVRVDEPGRDGVDADLVWRKLHGQRFGQHEDGALGRVVRRHAVSRQPDVGRLRREQDHAAPRALLHHLLGHTLCDEKCSPDLVLLLVGP
jgi:hypothetical protein